VVLFVSDTCPQCTKLSSKEDRVPVERPLEASATDHPSLGNSSADQASQTDSSRGRKWRLVLMLGGVCFIVLLGFFMLVLVPAKRKAVEAMNRDLAAHALFDQFERAYDSKSWSTAAEVAERVESDPYIREYLPKALGALRWMLAEAYARTGKFQQAVDSYQKHLESLKRWGPPPTFDDFRGASVYSSLLYASTGEARHKEEARRSVAVAMQHLPQDAKGYMVWSWFGPTRERIERRSVVFDEDWEREHQFTTEEFSALREWLSDCQ
jgi:tetratricopeptide (TPR) repeat protein